jgi:hypothetical protein
VTLAETLIVTHTMTKRVFPQHETAAGMVYGSSEQRIAAAPAPAPAVTEDHDAAYRPKKKAPAAGPPAAGHRPARARGPPQLMSPERLHRTQALSLFIATNGARPVWQHQPREPQTCPAKEKT